MANGNRQATCHLSLSRCLESCTYHLSATSLARKACQCRLQLGTVLPQINLEFYNQGERKSGLMQEPAVSDPISKQNCQKGPLFE